MGMCLEIIKIKFSELKSKKHNHLRGLIAKTSPVHYDNQTGAWMEREIDCGKTSDAQKLG
jgi:hypothetical protein